MPDRSEVLVVRANADVDVPATPSCWHIHVVDPIGPFSGLFAWGDSLHSARQALADVVWTAAHAAPDVDTSAITAVRIFTLTRKTFPVGTLDEATTS